MKFFTKGQRVLVTTPDGKTQETTVRGQLDTFVLVDRLNGMAGVDHVHQSNVTHKQEKHDE